MYLAVLAVTPGRSATLEIRHGGRVLYRTELARGAAWVYNSYGGRYAASPQALNRVIQYVLSRKTPSSVENRGGTWVYTYHLTVDDVAMVRRGLYYAEKVYLETL